MYQNEVARCAPSGLGRRPLQTHIRNVSPSEICIPGDLGNWIKTGLCVAGRTNQEADRFKFIYATGLRIEICAPGDPATCVKTRLRFARRANREAERLKLVYITSLCTEIYASGDPAKTIVLPKIVSWCGANHFLRASKKPIQPDILLTKNAFG